VRKKFCYISLIGLRITGYFPHAAVQSKTVYSNSQLSFQYGFSIKGLVEFSLKKNPSHLAFAYVPILELANQ
jgi:hypothetical protein